MTGFILKTWRVHVVGHSFLTYYATTRGKALSKAWESYISAGFECSFKQFMRIANARQTEADERFGEEIIVSGRLGYWVSCDSQYVQFVLPGTEDILNAHPYDVLPVEARLGTAYYSEAA